MPENMGAHVRQRTSPDSRPAMCRSDSASQKNQQQ